MIVTIYTYNLYLLFKSSLFHNRIIIIYFLIDDRTEIKLGRIVQFQFDTPMSGWIMIGLVHSNPEFREFEITTISKSIPFEICNTMFERIQARVLLPDLSGTMVPVYAGFINLVTKTQCLDLRFNVFSTDKINFGNKKLGKLQEVVIIPMTNEVMTDIKYHSNQGIYPGIQALGSSLIVLYWHHQGSVIDDISNKSLASGTFWSI